MAESFSREKLKHAPQKEGGSAILCDLPPGWPAAARLVRPTNLMSRINVKKAHIPRGKRGTVKTPVFLDSFIKIFRIIRIFVISNNPLFFSI